MSAIEPSPADPAAALGAAIAGGIEIIAARALGRGDDCRDAVQETLARALEAVRRGRVPPATPLGVFVYGIARHVIADVLRQRARRGGPAVDPETLAGSGHSALDQLILDEERRATARAVARLAAADRELLQACYVRGERLADIAARLGEPADRVRKRKSRALMRLREALGSPAGGAAARHTVPPDPTMSI